MLEKTITNGLIKALNKRDNVSVRKRFSNGHTNGYPDVTGTLAIDVNGVVLGVRIEIEVKQLGKKPRKLQYHRLKKENELGVCCGWCDSIEGGLAIVDDFEVMVLGTVQEQAA